MGDAQRGQAPFPLCVSIGRYGTGTVGKLVPTRRIFVHFNVVAGTVYKSSTDDATLEIILSLPHDALIQTSRIS